MIHTSGAIVLSRRGVLMAAAGCAGSKLMAPPDARADTDVRVDTDMRAAKLIADLAGKTPTRSDRVRLVMPGVFPNGYTVPLFVEVESPMTVDEFVKTVRVVAPLNPIVEVATFHFSPGRSQARVSTRIRLAAPQFVAAAAEMSDGSLLMAEAWVDVASNGCK